MAVPISLPPKKVGRHIKNTNPKKNVTKACKIAQESVKKPLPAQTIMTKPPCLQPAEECKQKKSKKKSKKRRKVKTITGQPTSLMEAITGPPSNPEVITDPPSNAMEAVTVPLTSPMEAITIQPTSPIEAITGPPTSPMEAITGPPASSMEVIAGPPTDPQVIPDPPSKAVEAVTDPLTRPVDIILDSPRKNVEIIMDLPTKPEIAVAARSPIKKKHSKMKKSQSRTARVLMDPPTKQEIFLMEKVFLMLEDTWTRALKVDLKMPMKVLLGLFFFIGMYPNCSDCTFVEKGLMMTDQHPNGNQNGSQPSVKEAIKTETLEDVTAARTDHDGLHCVASVPVSDCPVILHHNETFTLPDHLFCPSAVRIFGSCSACFDRESLLNISCPAVVPGVIRVEHGKGNGQTNLVTMTAEAVPPSALNCMTSVPVSDGPITLQYNSQEVILQERTSCPQKVHMFGFCSACFREESQLEIACSDAITLEIKHGNLHEDRALVRIIPKALDCNHFVKKRHQHRMEKSEQPSSSVHPKVDLRVRKRSMKQKHENMASMENDDDFCNVAVPVTDFPIVIVEDDHNFTFHEATFCPTKDDIFESCSACFQNKTMLEIFCKKRADEDYRLFWVEHGNGQGVSNPVYINFEECHQNGNDVSKRQADRPDGGTSTETIQANKGTSWRDSGIFVIPLLFLLALLVGFL